MIDRTTRLRWRRQFRRSKRQVEDISIQAEEQLERHFIRRLSRLNDVRRFVAGWLTLLVLLIGLVVVQTRALSSYYQVLQPIPGGTYTEGILGVFTNANPLFAVGTVDSSIARLVFSGLLKFDQSNGLTGDLAEIWKAEDNGRRYTVQLRPDLKWHDGSALTSADVLFTYQLIQNADTRSPLFSSWQGVKIAAPDERTIVFTLPNTLASFPYSMTNGIVPKHRLEHIAPEQLRSSTFNTVAPIGSGPFRWDAVEVHGDRPEDREERVGLVANEQYHHGKPKLQRFTLRTFRSEERMLRSFESQEINAFVGVNSVPDTVNDNRNVQVRNIPLTGAVMVFFKNTQDILKDVQVRRALIRAVQTDELLDGLDYAAIPVDAPLLKTHVGYDKKIRQFSYNLDQANKLLDKAGWRRGEDGMRQKKDIPLKLRLYAQNTSEFAYVSEFLQEKWRELGVGIEVILPEDSEFQSTVVQSHGYDMVVYGISLGVDPDVFAYWHSSQADVRSASRLNLSEYISKTADEALEGGRTRINDRLRTVKYKPFLQAWRDDAPALALYQPRFLYAVRGGLFNFEPTAINVAADRFANVHEWMIRQGKVNKP